MVFEVIEVDVEVKKGPGRPTPHMFVCVVLPECVPRVGSVYSCADG